MNFIRYMRNGFGFLQSFYLAFGKSFWLFLADMILFIVVAGATIITAYFISECQVQESNVRVDQAQNSEYVRELERVVAVCTSRGDNPINIGGELHFCGAHNTGIKL